MLRRQRPADHKLWHRKIIWTTGFAHSSPGRVQTRHTIHTPRARLRRQTLKSLPFTFVAPWFCIQRFSATNHSHRNRFRISNHSRTEQRTAILERISPLTALTVNYSHVAIIIVIFILHDQSKKFNFKIHISTAATVKFLKRCKTLKLMMHYEWAQNVDLFVDFVATSRRTDWRCLLFTELWRGQTTHEPLATIKFVPNSWIFLLLAARSAI